jgi:polar amino acid transport system substrate-binding protein
MHTKKIARWACGLLAALATLFSLSARAGESKPILVMVGDNWCPYNCAPQAQKRGYLIDVLERVLGPHFTLTYQLKPWTRAISMVESNEAQLLIATPATTKQKIVSSAPLGLDRTCFFVRKGNPWRFGRMDDLKNMRLGVVQDYSYDDNGPLDNLIAAYRKEKNPNLEITVGENALEGNFRKLWAGRMDVVVENENVGRYMIQNLKLEDSIDFAQCATHRVSTTHVAVSAKRSDAKYILSLINNGVNALRRSGELNTILKPYGLLDWQPVKTVSSNQTQN